MKNKQKTDSVQLKECPSCGGKHRADARFCSKTGQPIVAPARPRPENLARVNIKVPVIASPAANPLVVAVENNNDEPDTRSLPIEKQTDSKQPCLDVPALEKDSAPSTLALPIKVCPSCDALIDGSRKSAFCGRCGSKLLSSIDSLKRDDLDNKEKVVSSKYFKEIKNRIPTAKPDIQSCPYTPCKKTIGPGHRFCPKCYNRLRTCTKCKSYNSAWSLRCSYCKEPIAADSADWPMFKGNPERTGNTLETIKSDLDLAWRYPDQKEAEKITSSPVIYRGMVFYGSYDRHLHALNQYTGELIWKRPTNGYVHSTPAIYKGILYAASCDGKIYAQEARTGRPIWAYPLMNEFDGNTTRYLGGVTAPLLVCEAGVIVAYESGEVHCLDYKTGRVKWHKGFEMNITETDDDDDNDSEIVGGAAYSDGLIFIATRSGRVYCLADESGEELWKFPNHSPLNSPFVSTPAAIARKCYIPDRSGKFYAISLSTGIDMWNFTVNLGGVVQGSPSIGFGKVIIGTQDQFLVALNLNTGGEMWRQKNEKTRLFDSIYSTATITKNGMVFVGSNGGNLYCRDLNSGEELWKYTLDSPIASSPAVSDSFLYITTSGGYLYAFKEK